MLARHVSILLKPQLCPKYSPTLLLLRLCTPNIVCLVLSYVLFGHFNYNDINLDEPA